MNPEVAAYLDKLAPSRRETTLALRQLIMDTLPQAEESLQYRMPVYMVSGKPVVAIASQKRYFSLYVDVKTLEANRQHFTHLNCGKSCIRFQRLSQLPIPVIQTILLESITPSDCCV